MTLKEDFVYFCNSTSLRGVAKAAKSPTRSLRAVWAAYVLVMAAALFACVAFIVSDYLQYKTIIQATLVINDVSKHSHPALTFCNHYPFSETARQLWASGEVMSPTNYSRLIRRMAFEAFNRSDFASMESLLSYDTKRMYYQSLSHEDALRISFTKPQVFIFCIRGHGQIMDISEYNRCKFIIKNISMPAAFNCFQVQIDQPHDWITLILHVVKGTHNRFEEAFVQDIFEQASGIRLQVHENDTYPDPTAKGIHIEPGKLMEINYRHVRWHEADTPRDFCIHEDAARARRVRDLGQDFAYSSDGCTKAAIGSRVLRQCGCYFADYLREDVPNATHPYCGDMRLGLARVRDNVRCLSAIDFTAIKIELMSTECATPCAFSHFDTFTSQTVWKATDWQLYWLLKQSQSFAKLRGSEKLPPGEERTRTFRAAESDLLRLFTMTNLSTNLDARRLDFKSHNDEFAYLTIRRQSCNTLQKRETQSLNLSALMSQVGGLCSLFLGLTCAFVVELLEVFLMRRRRGREAAAAVAAVATAAAAEVTSMTEVAGELAPCDDCGGGSENCAGRVEKAVPRNCRKQHRRHRQNSHAEMTA